MAWLFHLIDADDLMSLEADAARLTFDEREQYLRHFAPRANPLVMSSFDVQSTTGAKVRFYAIALPFTSKQMKQWLDEADFFRVRHSIDKAIKVARFIGCDVIALGQYTSIVTRNATTLRAAARRPDDRQQLHHRAGAGSDRAGGRASAGSIRRRRRSPSSARRATSARPVRRFWRRGSARTVLLGSSKPSAVRRLADLQARLPRAQRRGRPGGAAARRTSCSPRRTRRSRFSAADVFADGAIVCDLSVPAAVRPEVRETRPDVLLIGGGIARLPFGEDHGILGFPLPPGQVYGCMAETMLLGLEGVRDATFTGHPAGGARLPPRGDGEAARLHARRVQDARDDAERPSTFPRLPRRDRLKGCRPAREVARLHW